MTTRVAVTGLAVFSPLGKKLEFFWDKLRSGENAYRPISCFSLSKEFKPWGYTFPEKTNTQPQLFTWLSHVVEQTIADSGLKKAPMAGVAALHPILHHPLECSLDQWLSSLARNYKSNKKPLLMNGACASGNLALGYAADLVRYQDISPVLVFGGNEVNEVVYKSFRSLQILSDDQAAPFCKNRKGMGLGEGAVALILEKEEAARKRGAHIYGYIKGWSSALDGHSTTGFSPSAYGPSAALWWALQDAKLNPGEIQWICAHGTGTIKNDQAETKAIKQIFKNAAYELSVTSNKAQVGHLLEGAGLMNAAVAILGLNKQTIPGTYNYKEKDEECDLDYLPNKNKDIKIKNIISNSYGFGGICSSVVIGGE